MDVQRNKACEKICYPETPKARRNKVIDYSMYLHLLKHTFHKSRSILKPMNPLIDRD